MTEQQAWQIIDTIREKKGQIKNYSGFSIKLYPEYKKPRLLMHWQVVLYSDGVYFFKDYEEVNSFLKELP